MTDIGHSCDLGVGSQFANNTCRHVIAKATSSHLGSASLARLDIYAMRMPSCDIKFQSQMPDVILQAGQRRIAVSESITFTLKAPTSLYGSPTRADFSVRAMPISPHLLMTCFLNLAYFVMICSTAAKTLVHFGQH